MGIPTEVNTPCNQHQQPAATSAAKSRTISTGNAPFADECNMPEQLGTAATDAAQQVKFAQLAQHLDQPQQAQQALRAQHAQSAAAAQPCQAPFIGGSLLHLATCKVICRHQGSCARLPHNYSSISQKL